LNYLDRNCERSEFFQTLSSNEREDLRPGRKGKVSSHLARGR
jgi:hypothetical protein